MSVRALVLGLALFVGCGTETGEQQPAASVDVIVSTVAYLPPNDITTPVDGVEVCVVEPLGFGCEASDAAGEAFLSALPANGRVSLRLERAGFVASVRDFVFERDERVAVPLVSESLAEAFADLVSLAWPDTENGIIAFDTGTTPNIAATISPQVGEGPFYLDDNGLPDPELTATSSAGIGFLVALPPDDYEVSFPGCSEVEYGVQGAVPHAARTAAPSGGIAFVIMVCP